MCIWLRYGVRPCMPCGVVQARMLCSSAHLQYVSAVMLVSSLHKYAGAGAVPGPAWLRGGSGACDLPAGHAAVRCRAV